MFSSSPPPGPNADQLTHSWAPFVAGKIVTTVVPCGHERMTAPEAC